MECTFLNSSSFPLSILLSDKDMTAGFGLFIKYLEGSRFTKSCVCRVGTTQESYALLTKYELVVPREETELCDTLRYTWQKLQQQASTVSSQLIQVQPTFRRQLVTNVHDFNADCNHFYASYRQVCSTYLLFWIFFITDADGSHVSIALIRLCDSVWLSAR